MSLPTARLGTTDLEITRVGFGAWAIGGGSWVFGWGSQDDTDSVDAIRHAVDHGINWIDTAAVYGLGHSEEVVGQAIKDVPGRPYIFTKCGMLWDSAWTVKRIARPDTIPRELEASLQRLGGRAHRSLPGPLAARGRHPGRGVLADDGAAEAGGQGPGRRPV